MKVWLLNFLLIVFGVKCAHAQKAEPEKQAKVDLEKWVTHTVDSLKKKHIDTIEYYHAYCGECIIEEKPPLASSPNQCDVGNGWVQIQTKIIYKQKDKYYSLTFNCSNPPIVKELRGVKSLDYFLSIVPVLIKRDKYGEYLQKKHKFNPPIVVDGGYEEAVLYCKGIKENVYMQDDQKTDTAWRAFFWIDKQTKLLALLETETSSKN